MRQNISADVLNELSGDNYIPVILLELDFPSGMIYTHNGVGELIFNGNSYLGVGQLGSISPLEESTELKSLGFSLELSGIDPALVSISLNDNIQGRSAAMYIAFLDTSHAVVADPVGPWSGRMDVLSGEIGKTATLVLTVESRLADWERPNMRRYTDADQKSEFPGDKGFEFVSQLQDREILWGPK